MQQLAKGGIGIDDLAFRYRHQQHKVGGVIQQGAKTLQPVQILAQLRVVALVEGVLAQTYDLLLAPLPLIVPVTWLHHKSP